ncbi:MAG: hypothetical protein Q4C70_03500 [Planctomycetia bacterium]|nr:hypothetical protein [Planctomycetia bacterium]
MEWNREYWEYFVNLGSYIEGVLPTAPEDFIEDVRKLNREQFEFYKFNRYVGLDPDKQKMVKLVNPLPIIKEKDHIVFVHLIGIEGIFEQKFPKYGITCENGRIVAITESLRDDLIAYTSTKLPIVERFFPSLLDVSEEM